MTAYAGAVTCARPGTHAGLNAHRRAWEPACDDCKAFGAAYQRQRRADGEARDKAREASRRRSRALSLLAKRHRSEYLELLRTVS